MALPISLEQSATRSIIPVSNSAEDFRDTRQQQPSTYVYHGELLETDSDRRYRPQLNLQISPENRRAISTYHKIADEPARPGRILDGYI